MSKNCKNVVRRMPVQSLWIGDSLSVLEQLCIRSFQENGHEFHLYVYEDIAQLPADVIVKDAKDIIPKNEIFRVRNSLAIFSDLFRWKLLSNKGGCWVDMDMICLKPFEFSEEVVFGLQSDDLVATGVLVFPPEHYLAEWIANNCMHPNQTLPYDSWSDRIRKFTKKYLLGNQRKHLRWGEAGGPKGLSAILKHVGMFEFAKPANIFYPVAASQWKSHFDETYSEGLNFFNDSYATHLWNEILSANRFHAERGNQEFDKNGPFIKGSFIDQMIQRYCGSMKVD